MTVTFVWYFNERNKDIVFIYFIIYFIIYLFIITVTYGALC